MAGTQTSFSASVQAKKGCLYAVIPYTINGTRKTAWRSLKLSEGAPKTKVNKALREALVRFEEEYDGMIRRTEWKGSTITMPQYLESWLKKYSRELQQSTINGYRSMINGKIKRYFGDDGSITIASVTPEDINGFYESLFDEGCVANTVIHYHAFLSRAFAQARKDKLIESNPFDEVDRPRKNRFHGESYTEEELMTLLRLTHGDPIYPAIILAGCLGMRRSEALGVRWSRIDWNNNTVLLDTKIIEIKENHTSRPLPVEEMKTESSRRTLPLPEPVIEMLREQQAHQQLCRSQFKNCYNYEFNDYVCTDDMGNLLTPAYVTVRFSRLLKKYGLRKIRFHDLRHTFASLLIKNKVPLINVSSLLGHSALGTTAAFYIHLDRELKTEGTGVIDGIWSGRISGDRKQTEES